MSPDADPPVRFTEPGEEATPSSPNGAAGPGKPGGRMPRAALLRLVLLALSAAGVLAALALWAAGHGTAALRVLAGDVLALVIVLLLAS